MSLLSCENIQVSYDSKTVLKNVSFTVMPKDYLCIVGENGSGKTTLMKAILGLIKPDEGKITYNNLKKNEIGYMPQQTVVQKDFPASVFEIVLSGRLNQHPFTSFYKKKDKEAAFNNLKKLGIENLQKKPFGELSAGQQQRVLLARALCAAKKLIMLDEPITGLDPMTANEMYGLLKKLNKEDGLSVIMISHDIPSSVRYGGKILHLRETPIFYGTSADYAKSNIGTEMITVDIQEI